MCIGVAVCKRGQMNCCLVARVYLGIDLVCRPPFVCWLEGSVDQSIQQREQLLGIV